MISISGIKYQKELEKLPCFNKNQASILIGKKGKNLDKKIGQLKKIKYLLTLKKGLYTSTFFYEKTQKEQFGLYVANQLRSPSYISSEYVLSNQGLIPEAVYGITSITPKSTRTYKNFLGTFTYRNIKTELFLGFEEIAWDGKTIFMATPAKALFDFLYLKSLPNLKQEILYDLRVNWENLSKDMLVDFEKYVLVSKSKKMKKILEIIKKNYVS